MYNLKEKNGLTINKPDAGEKTLFLDLDGKVKTKDENGDIEEISIANSDAPKVYKALLTQSGTDAPVATVLENTLGFTVDWIYEGEGGYKTDTGGLLIESTYLVLFGSGRSFNRNVSYSISGDNEIELYTYLNEVQSNNVITSPISVLIEVYP